MKNCTKQMNKLSHLFWSQLFPSILFVVYHIFNFLKIHGKCWLKKEFNIHSWLKISPKWVWREHILTYYKAIYDSPLVAQTVKSPPAMWETWFNPWVGKIPWRQEQLPTPVFSPGESLWTEEPGRLQSMWLQRVRHDWATFALHFHSQCNTQWWKTENLIPKFWNTMRLSILPLLFSIVLEVLDIAVRQEKEVKSIQIGREEIILSLCADYLILYTENLKATTQKLPEWINEFGKVVGYRINI